MFPLDSDGGALKSQTQLTSRAPAVLRDLSGDCISTQVE
jgi:hypothetical protein